MKIVNPEIIVRPCDIQARRWIEKLSEDERFVVEDSIIDRMFRRDVAGNGSIEEIYEKCVVLNQIYATVIYNVWNVAKKMSQIDGMDEMLAAGDISLVDKIAGCGDGRRLYSFATKYCCLHRHDKFPIYDSIVHYVLNYVNRVPEWHFTDVNTSTGERSQMRDYTTYKTAVDDFIRRFGLHGYSYRDIDKYLWMMGREATGQVRKSEK